MMATFTVVLLLALLFAGVPVALALIGSSLAAVFTRVPRRCLSG